MGAEAMTTPQTTDTRVVSSVSAARRDSAQYAGERSLVSWEEIQDLELVILRRMREFGKGNHPSLFRGGGFDFVGLRDWEPGDRVSTVDWAQSTIANFSPLVTREFEQESPASVSIVADTSLSTRCGVHGVPIAQAIARAVATLALGAAFAQDRVGLITFDGDHRQLATAPRAGRNHAIHCVDAYEETVLGARVADAPRRVGGFAGFLRQVSLVPVVSDFLLEKPEALLRELIELTSVHDVFLVMIDGAFAFEFQPPSARWVSVYDVETGRSRLVSARELASLAKTISDWQDKVEQIARRGGMDVLRVRAKDRRFHDALVEFFAYRRRRGR